MIESVHQKSYGTTVASVNVKRECLVDVVEHYLGEIPFTFLRICKDARGNVIRVERNGQVDRTQSYEFDLTGNWIRCEKSSIDNIDNTERIDRVIEYWS